jgi:hypothetical protein
MQNRANRAKKLYPIVGSNFFEDYFALDGELIGLQQIA